MPAPIAVDLVTAFYDQLWNHWNDALVDDVLAHDFDFRGSLGTSTRGRAEWREYRDRVRSGAPDFHNLVVDLVGSGDRATARLRYTGTHTGVLLGRPPTGRRFAYDGAAFFTARDGRLARAWVLGDLAGLTRQLEGEDDETGPRRAGEPAPRAVDRATAPHYRWGAGCDGWRLVDRDDLSVIEERMPPGTAEDTHVHDRARQFFYVLAGDAELRIGDAVVPLTSGVGAEVPPGHPHRLVNVGSGDLTFVVTSTPTTRGDRRPPVDPRS